MKNIPVISFILCLLIFSAAFAKTEIVLGDIPLGKNNNIPGLMLKSADNSDEVIVSRKQYVISYNRKIRAPNWVAWKLDQADIGHIGRSNIFLPDNILENYLSQYSEHVVQPTDYFGSCYDRGHQAPSADRDDSLENNQATFLMSNMIPQTAYLNRVIWEHLEAYTRDLVVNQNKKVFIIAGPIYDEDFGMIGPDKNIRVPSKNFKIIYVLNAGQSSSEINASTPTISVIMPNLLQSGKKPFEDTQELCKTSTHALIPMAKNDWQQYQTSINEIEKESGFILAR
jgi:endonuclease G